MSDAHRVFESWTWMYKAQHLQDLKPGDKLVKLTDYGIGTPKDVVYTFHSYHPEGKRTLILCGLEHEFMHLEELYAVNLPEHSINISDFRKFNPDTDGDLPAFSPEEYHESLRIFIGRWGA